MEVHEIADGEVLVWVDDSGVICLKAIAPGGDPVELAEHQARELGELLLKLVSAMRD